MEYQAPEHLLGWAHDFAVDCWSFGALLHFLLAGTVSLSSRAVSLTRKLMARWQHRIRLWMERTLTPLGVEY
jgi:hypothetical protein